MNIRKCEIALLFVLFANIYQFAYSQEPLDTIILNPVEITAETSFSLPSHRIDSLSSISNNLTSVLEQIKQYTPIFIREYSPGGISTVAFRGTGASHTIVLFDGFPINPAMSGQVDLSSLPPFLYDHLVITPSPQSILFHPSAIGGLISMHTQPQMDKFSVSVRTDVGSFGNVGSGLNVHTKFGRFSARTRAYFQQCNNDFPFINNTTTQNNQEKRINASYEKRGFVQEFYRRGNNNTSFIKFSALQNNNQLPVLLLQAQIEDNETMQNSVYRLIGGYGITKNNIFFLIKSHLANETWNYENPQSGIHSQNIIHTASFIADMVIVLKKMELTTQGYVSHRQVESSNFAHTKNMQDMRLTVKSHFKSNTFSLQPVVHFLRNDHRNNISVALLIQKSILKEQGHIQLSTGRMVRFPGMNDLYWSPGGNTLLVPETGYNAHTRFVYNIQKQWSVEAGIHSAYINNWIVWQPTSVSSIWSPENVRLVNTGSMDFMNVISGKIKGFTWKSVASYSHQVSLDKSKRESAEYNKQLIYVPMHIASHLMQINVGKMNISLRSQYTGKRFTRPDNLAYMPAHFHHDLLMSYQLTKNKLHIELFAGIYNLTAENYQVIAWQPMPQRHFRVSIQFKFNEKK
jgi:vitamin B12 transporter